MRVLHRLWADDAGFVVSTELVLVATVLVIGLVLGLTELRNQVVQELGDLAQAIANINQSYEYAGTAKAEVAETAGSDFHDERDFCEGIGGDDSEGNEPCELSVRTAPQDECDPLIVAFP
jgi:HAMP domain-containing protein